MKTWLFVGSLAAGVLLFVYEWYCSREQAYEEGQHGPRGRLLSEEDFIEINETTPMELERRLGSRAKLPGTEELCSICLDNLIRRDTGERYCIIALPQCGHWFHQRCALRLLEYHPQCPVCRIDIDSAALKGTPVRLIESISETGDNNSTETSSNKASSSSSTTRQGGHSKHD